MNSTNQSLDHIQKILNAKQSSDSLAHFYILEPSQSCENKILNSWTETLLKEFCGGISPENHQDVFILKSDEKSKQYSLDEISSVLSFANHKAVQLNRKYLVLTEAEKITTIQFNKLLKTFEEPPVPMTIFLINSGKVQILETIRSRGIVLRIPVKPEDEENTLQKYLDSNIEFHVFSKELQDANTSLPRLVKDALDLVNKNPPKEQSFKIIKKEIEALREDHTFNNSWHQQMLRLNKILNLIK